jgi:hypothetical protein
MKLQSAPRRSTTRVEKAVNDYLDLERLLSNAELVPEIARHLATEAPHDLGIWALERIRFEFIEHVDGAARSIRRTGLAPQRSAGEIEATATAFLARAASLTPR